MGKVCAAFTPGWPGSISRSADDIVVALASRESEAEIAFGAPVWLADAGSGVRNWVSGDTLEGFVGFAVRVPAKTPRVYPLGAADEAGSRGSWQPGEPVDVLVRGSIVVDTGGSPVPGGQVYLNPATGKITASPGSNPASLELTGCRFRGESDSRGRAEIVIGVRHAL